MATVNDVSHILEQFAPLYLAEEWDNVGLLIGNRERPVKRIMTCLTVTPASAREAVAERADLIVTHHPLPFQPVQRLTSETTSGGLLLQLIEAGIAVYSPHTAFDSAQDGINQQLALGLGLEQILPLRPLTASDDSGEPHLETLGAGRIGHLATPGTLVDFAQQVRQFLKLEHIRVVGNDKATLAHVATACGSGGSFLSEAINLGCDCLVTGEANFHTCLEAEAAGVALVLTGHYASERFAVEALANYLAEQFPNLEAWASRQEADPLRTL